MEKASALVRACTRSVHVLSIENSQGDRHLNITKGGIKRRPASIWRTFLKYSRGL